MEKTVEPAHGRSASHDGSAASARCMQRPDKGGTSMEQHWIAPVHDFMSCDLIAVLLGTPLVDVQRTLDQNEISAVPVVDEDGTLRGILSTRDLLRVARLEMTAPEDVVRIIIPAHRTASDVMRVAVLTIDEGAAIGKAG